MREGVNAICSVLCGGIAWRMMPKHFPLWSTAYRWCARLRDDGTWETINHHLVMRDRERSGREASPTTRHLSASRSRSAPQSLPFATLSLRNCSPISFWNVACVQLDAEAGQLTVELTRRGIAADARLQVVIDILDADALPMAAIAQAGRGLGWLSDEPDLYFDADLVDRAG